MSKRSVIVLAIVLVLSGFIFIIGEDDEPIGIQLPIDMEDSKEGELKLDHDQMPSYGHFIENKGQWDKDILFLASTSFGHIGLGKNSVFFDVRDIQEIENKPKNKFEMISPMKEELPPELEINGHVVKYTFEGAKDMIPIGVDPKVQLNNYFIGNDPGKWVRGARTFESVEYKGLYKEIDLKYYFNEKGPKYDFILNPGAEPDDIEISIEGHDSIRLNDDGMSVLLPNGKSISDSGLISFYDDQRNSKIHTNFDFINDDTFKLDLGNYDSSKRVVVDPLIFCTYIGTNDYEHFGKFHIGRNDRIYFFAVTISSNFPTSPGAYDDTHHTGRDFVAFFMDPDASDILNATYIGGDDEEWAGDFYLDNSENFILTGQSDSSDFPTTSGAFQTSHGGGRDIVLLKVKNDCTDLVFSTYVGGSELDSGGIYLDSNMNFTIYGHTESNDFPTTTGAYQETYKGGDYDTFIIKINSTGKDAIFSTYLGGTGSEMSSSFQYRDNGNIILSGRAWSTDFPTTNGAYDTVHDGTAWDGFVVELKNDGSDLIFSTFFGGNNRDNANRLIIDGNGDIIIGGNTQSDDFPTTVGAFNRSFMGGDELFVLKLKGDGSDLMFSTFIGGSKADSMGGMMTDNMENIYVAGSTTSDDFPTTIGAYDTTYNDDTQSDIYYLKLKNDGSDLIFSTYIGGDHTENVGYLNFDDYGNIFMSGGTHSGDFPTTPEAIHTSGGASGDPFFLQMNYDASELMYSTYLGGNGEESARIFQDPYGTVYAGGITTSTNLPTTPGGFSDDFMGSYDIYLYKFSIEVNTEPTEVHSVEAYSQPDFTEQITMVDKGTKIYVELVGLDGNSSHRDNTLVEVSFRWTPHNGFNLPLRETGKNTGIYRGDFSIPFNIDYFEEITIFSKKFPSKLHKLYVDSPFRPVSVSDLDVYTDPGFSYKSDNIDIGQDIFVKIVGEDASPLTTDFAFVNITKNENETYLLMERLEETGFNTGIYAGSFPAPSTFDYFDNITIYSVRNHDAKDTFMVHTPVQIRPFENNLTATEDMEYRESYWNFGYETGTWNMDTLAKWLNWDEEKNEIYGTPDNSEVGPWDVWLTLEDGKGHIDERSFQVVVDNSDPEILTNDTVIAKEGDHYYVDYNSTDDGQGVIIWSIISYSTWLTIDEGTGVLSGVPTHTEIGRHAISVIVDDGNGGTDRHSFDIEVRGFNRPPEIISLDITTGTQGELYYRDYEAHDPNENDVLEWFLDTNASFLSIENDTGILTGTPGAEDAGVFYVNVTVKDQDGLMDSHVFDLTIENVNDMPLWDSVPEDVEVYHGQHFIFDVNALDYDIGDVLLFSIRSKPDSDIDIDPDTGEIDWIASVQWFDEEPFEMEVTIEVTDGELRKVHKFTLTVLPTEPPTVQLTGPDTDTRTPSTDTVLEWEGSDPEDDPITYDIYIHENQAFVDGKREEALHLEEYAGESYTVVGLPLGKTYYWMIVPHDGCSYGECTTGTRSFTLNNPPTVNNVPDQEISSGSEFKFRVTTSDDDDMDKGNLIHTLVNSPEGMRISEDTGTIRWTPSSDQAGWHTITVGVYDGIETTSTTFDIEVIASDESEFPIMIVVIIGGIIGLVIILLLVFLLIRKREPSEKEPKQKKVDEESEEIIREMEEHQKELDWEQGIYKTPEETAVSDVPLSAAEAHAHDKDRKYRKPGYEELYGQPAPEVEEEDVTTEDLKDTLKETVEKLEQMEPPKEEGDFLDDLISHAHVESEDIVHRGIDEEIDVSESEDDGGV